ncbi:hypothetical protein CFC21_111711 [Triticum aestivum]|uniref:NB-ARC domain-containing protein n=6 Tax=Triticinae TaxID=1648030 RepID=A0A9R1NFC5_WHEAT|nr:hypothetical protein CFC21_111711 [Triticum aestivum]
MTSSPYGMLSPVVGLFMDEIWKPIKKHCGYCLKPGRKVDDLDTCTRGLRVHIDTIVEQIQLGKRPRVQTTKWIQSAKSIEVKSCAIVDKFKGRSKHMLGCSWNCWFNYRIGRAARKTKKEVVELKERTPQNNGIFTLLPSVGIELPLPPNIVGQNEYMDKIVGCIEKGSTRLVAICGMGGSGKTTLLAQINNTFSCPTEMHTFHHVIYVEIGQQQNIGIIQKSIASQLGLTLGLDENTTSRSASLYNFLKERKFLLLMDNLWQPLDLVKIGIPQEQISPHNTQMIVITARDQQICRRMQAHCQVFVLQKLKFEGAWSLFEANSGCYRLTKINAQIRVYAEIIVNKCGGLPLALKIVGQAMASKENEQDWELVVMLLQRSQFNEVPDANAETDLYHVLYISYEQLPDERTKQCFLYFALILDDGVYVSHAIRLVMGHGLFDEDNANDLRVRAVIGCLKRACLLEEHPRGQNYLSMHDTIKGLALWIVQCKHGDGPSKNWLVRKGDETIKSEEWCTAHRISLHMLNDVVIPCSVPCSWLLTLIVRRGSIIGNVPTGFFRTAPSLTFLDISGTNIREIPSDVGELVNLQHFDVSDTPIRSIPRELQLLKNLRYLYLRNTYALVTIPDGTISALTMLRVLDLYYSGPFPADTTHAHIKELESLSWLQSLGFTVSDSNSLQMILSPSNKASLKRLCLDGVEGLPHLSIAPAYFIKTRVHELERLTLNGMRSLKELSIGDTFVDSDWHFKKLDELNLWNLGELEGVIWKGLVPHACFPKLRVLLVSDCHSIITVSWVRQLPCLEEVYLVRCHSLLELVVYDAEDDRIKSSIADSFPRLKVLGLSGLSNLHNICDGTLAFPSLKRLLVYSCPRLAKLPSGLHREERVPVILGSQDWWGQLVWEDSSMESNLNPFFRELPSNFQGNFGDLFTALAYW